MKTGTRDSPAQAATTIFLHPLAPIALISREVVLRVITLIGPLLAREIGTIGMTEVIGMIEMIEDLLVIGMREVIGMIEIQGLILALLVVEVTIVAIVILEMVVEITNETIIVEEEETLKILTRNKLNEKFELSH